MKLEDYGFDNNMLSEVENLKEDYIPARVCAVHKERYGLVCEHGECYGRLKSSNYFWGGFEDFPTTGDFVLIKYNNSGDSQIIKTFPRKSKFERSDFSGHAAGFVKTIVEQVVAANFDYVFIVTSLNHDFNKNRIMRYLTQTLQSGGKPVVILTKADLCEDFSINVSEIEKLAPNVPVHAISSHTGLGLEQLNMYLQPGKTIVFLGMSGVGKSSLLNVMMGENVMKVRGIREVDSRGRHTTTHRQLFMLPSGAMVIDTPGMRELGLFDVEEGISQGFDDVESLIKQCRFSDCRHKTEPGCAIIEALNDGSLSQERWELYNAQVRENQFVRDKSAYIKTKRERNKSISMNTRQNKKYGGLKNDY